ncbi:FKBP-type peptidyl-prolyl cis-trans isomerase [Aggregatibacter actinomycetemcomitans]|uniref:FKBP-type peptidyl-prolyl cis-trans isomerase n=1 Tax=Aggregatibacter actinomycetemcomitans TaxID=714 RepID=UPI001E3525B6|nr:FKBP-type peptidyl-prolyl cis-trans isomerase [Aggregatibacter actinomycetemcomitans]
MLKMKKISVPVLILSAVVSSGVLAESKTAAKFTDDSSYAVGVLFGSDLQGLINAQKGMIDYNNAKVIAGISDVLNGKVKLEGNKEIASTLQGINAKLKAENEKRVAAMVKKAEEEGKKFTAEFAKKDGVKKTASGLLYRVEKEGSGDAIKAADVVKVHYTGKLPDGTVFDSSRERGTPAEFPLNQVIKGWTEGLQLVKKGGQIELVIPADLGYGEDGAGDKIPPHSTLYFDIEVLDVTPAK